MRTIRPLAALLSLAPVLAGAQSPPGTAGRPSERFLGGWMAASVAPSTRFGYITDRHYFVAALRAQFPIATLGPLALASTVDVVPLAMLSNTPEYQLTTFYHEGGTPITVKTETGRSPVFGAGIVPAGLQLYTRSTRPVRFFLGGSVGTLWFTRDTPVPHARRFNISADGSAGVEIHARDGGVFVVGYKFQHLSNAGTAALNPGVDTHLIYVGVMRRRGARQPAQVEPVAAQ
jgi:Lipid A 3-O-deacylase (PagL)